MKNLLLGFCLVSLAFACKSNDVNTVDDAGNATLPAAECGSACETECATECSASKAECSATKTECSSSKTECSSSKTECSASTSECSSTAKPECSGQVCPMTGQSIE